MLSAHEQPLVDSSIRQVVVPPEFLIAFPFELNQHRYHSVFLRAARRQARQSRPQFLYQRYGLNDLSGLSMRRRQKVPLILEFNGSEVWAQRHWGESLRFERLAQAIELVTETINTLDDERLAGPGPYSQPETMLEWFNTAILHSRAHRAELENLQTTNP